MAVAPFDYSLDFSTVDFRRRPELYRIGKGEQGVLLVEPYKSEILPHWRFKTVAEAKQSSAKIYRMFLAYLRANDFPGADMARKFLQMGWTRARRYANHQGGRKYDPHTGAPLPRVSITEIDYDPVSKIDYDPATKKAATKGAKKAAENVADKVTEKAAAKAAEKAAAAAIFYERYVTAREHPRYVRLKQHHRAK